MPFRNVAFQIWNERDDARVLPLVRYLLTDMTLGGNVKLYRDYATTERDPDSREAIRLWDAGARVVNTNEFERKWVTNQFGKDGRVMRIVQRGSNRTIVGHEVLLTTDAAYNEAQVRFTLFRAQEGGWESSHHPQRVKRTHQRNAGDAFDGLDSKARQTHLAEKVSRSRTRAPGR